MTLTTPPDNIMRLAVLDQFDDRVLYVEGTITSTGITGVSTTVIATVSEPPGVTVDEQGGSISLACNTNGLDYHVVWHEGTESSDNERIKHCKSSDGGASWGTPVQIAITPAIDDEFYSVRIMGDSAGKLFLLFQYEDDSEWGTPDAYQVYLYRSLDSGGSWSLVQTFGFADLYCDLQIDSSDNLYVFYWSDVSPFAIVCRKSTDNGANFGAEVFVFDLNSNNFKAEIDGNDHIYVVGELGGFAKDPYFTKSVDGGASFSAKTIISAGTMTFPGQVPWFTIVGDSIHFVWGDSYGAGALYYSHSGDLGASWDARVDMGVSVGVGFGDAIELNEQGSQCVLYEGSTILYVFGGNHFPSYPHLVSMTSDDGGATWTEAIILSYGKVNHWQPSLATYFTVAAAVTYFFLA